jgi:hypothetical protein
MKHEITTELRNSVIEALADAVTKFTFRELKELFNKLQTLPIISDESKAPSKEIAQK